MRFIFTLLLLLLAFTPQIYAQEDGSSAASLTTQASLHNDYFLVYPGILPNNPLYPIKMARDKIVLFLITDPVKRAKFNLLQADKRVAAGALLLKEDKKNEALAITTIEKGENYFHESMTQSFQIKREGREVNEFSRQLEKAVDKHIQVISDLKKNISHANSERIGIVLSRLAEYKKLIQSSH